MTDAEDVDMGLVAVALQAAFPLHVEADVDVGLVAVALQAALPLHVEAVQPPRLVVNPRLANAPMGSSLAPCLVLPWFGHGDRDPTVLFTTDGGRYTANRHARGRALALRRRLQESDGEASRDPPLHVVTDGEAAEMYQVLPSLEPF